jgi:hypothetical protein
VENLADEDWHFISSANLKHLIFEQAGRNQLSYRT